MFRRSERADAKKQAANIAQQEIAAERARKAAEYAALQADLDEGWQLLCANDPETTLDALEVAFEDNETSAAPINVEGDEATLVMLAPDVDVIPERFPTLTEAGNLTLKKLSKTDRSGFYKMLVCGHLLRTLKEAFAAAPAITSIRVVVLRASLPDAYGAIRPELLLAGHWNRGAFEGVQWETADAVLIVNTTATDLLISQRGAAKELAPIVLTKEPELAELVSQVDFADLIDSDS